jgi:SpoVK/Ycf46/Vps4 family AAA+-type ATPase
MIDRAMLRPGRLDKLLQVKLPVAAERHDILKTLSAKMPLNMGIQLELVAADTRCERMSGADLKNLLREAGVSSLRRTLLAGGDPSTMQIMPEDVEVSLSKVTPSVSTQDLRHYERLEKQLNGGGTS